jgi:hypothetical protein
LLEVSCVLRISWDAGPGPAQTLRLEGVLSGPWVVEVLAACAQAGVAARGLRLDLAAVTFVDAAGAGMLHDLMRQGVQLAPCSGFVRELLRPEEP